MRQYRQFIGRKLCKMKCPTQILKRAQGTLKKIIKAYQHATTRMSSIDSRADTFLKNTQENRAAAEKNYQNSLESFGIDDTWTKKVNPQK